METDRLLLGDLQSKSFGAPDDAEWSRISRHLVADVPREKILALPFALANDSHDRGDEAIPKPFLERLGQTIVGKPLLLHHNKNSVGEGVWYRAEVRPSMPGEAGDWTLEAWAYLLKTPGNAELRQKIDAGIAKFCSISFRYGKRLCDICACDYYRDCPHYRGQILEDGRRVTLSYGGDVAEYEAVEGSIVYLGAQRLAQLIKLAEGETSDMDIEKLAARLEATEKELAALKAGAAREPEKTAPDADLIADGRAYREALATEALKLAGLIGAEVEAKAALLGLEGKPLGGLVELRDAYQVRVEEKFPAQPVGKTGPEGTPGTPPEEEPRRGRRRFTL